MKALQPIQNKDTVDDFQLLLFQFLAASFLGTFFGFWLEHLRLWVFIKKPSFCGPVLIAYYPIRGVLSVGKVQ